MIWFVQSAMCALYPRTDELPGLEDCDVRAFLVRFRRETTGLMWLGVLLGALANSARATLRQGGVRWRGTFYPLPRLRRGQVR